MIGTKLKKRSLPKRAASRIHRLRGKTKRYFPGKSKLRGKKIRVIYKGKRKNKKRILRKKSLRLLRGKRGRKRAVLPKSELHACLKNPANIMDFSRSHNPRISIILVLFNKAEHTYKCLKTIMQFANAPYEIVIVDNGSKDETRSLLKRLKNATIHRNKRNNGFVTAANQGARLAQGEWFLFLNNDTELTPDVLNHLLRAGQEVPNCGVVGAKLVYPDGKLQEAGSIIWNDGSCWSYGRGDDPNKPEYDYLREVHYCSGACLMVRRDLFIRAGMLDEQYSPAYYEEADLCMKIRELGYKVIYQPQAVIIHHEFGSSSSSAAAQLQIQNRIKFRNKWQHRLNAFHSPGPENVILAREYPRGKRKILMIEDQIPNPDLGSGYPRTYAILNHLAELDYQVSVYPLIFPGKIEPLTHMMQQKGIEVMHSRGKSGFHSFIAERKYMYDAIWISRPHNMAQVIQTIKSVNPHQRTIYDAEALFSMRDILRLEVEGNEVSEEAKVGMIQQEVGLMSQADLVVAVSEHEKHTINRFIEKPVMVLGHTVDLRPTPKPIEDRHGLLFVGGFLSSPSPNEDAVHYLVNEIYPLVYRELGVKLWIVGTNHLPSVWGLASDNIVVTGRVDNLWDYFNNCRLFLAPTRYAAGIPLKVHDSLSHGLPTVVTPLLADQFSLDERAVLIGRSPQEFAEKIIRGYTDPHLWNSLRDNGLNYISHHCNQQAYKEKLNSLKQAW